MPLTLDQIAENEMVRAIVVNGIDFLVGSRDSGRLVKTAKEWREYGFTWQEAEKFWKKGVFSSVSAYNLKRQGIKPEQLLYEVGCQYSNNEMSFDDVLETLKQ